MNRALKAVGVASVALLVVACDSDDGGNDGAAGTSGAASGGEGGQAGARATAGGAAGMAGGAAGSGVDAGAGGATNSGGSSGSSGAAGRDLPQAGSAGAMDLGGEIALPQQPSGITLRLDSVVYEPGDTVEVELDFGDIDPGEERITIALACPDTGDAEPVFLDRASGNRFVASGQTPLTFSGSDPEDGELTVAPGELLHALYIVDRSASALADVEEDMVTDFGLIATDDTPSSDVEPALALTEDEGEPAAGAKAVGTLLPEGGLPVQIATEELIVFPKDDAELEAFLDQSGGSVIAEQVVDGGDGAARDRAVLVAVEPGQADPSHLGVLRQLFGETEALLVSRADVERILVLALEFQLEGFLVAVNPRLQFHGAPSISETEADNLTHTMQMVPARGVTEPCVPGDAERPCVENVPALWAFTALWDADVQEVNVGVLDIGFAPNTDFREPSSGSLVQCDMTVRSSPGYRCAAGAAEGPPTVGNSFFGDRSWHGTGVVTTIGGVVNDGFGAAGVAGLNAVPQLYKYDFLSYAFEIGGGILKALSDGASVINVSGGYPCRVITNVGPDFDVCSIEGRAGICAIVTASVHAAAATVCATLGGIPIVGGVACGAAVGGAVVATNACVSTLALGDVRSPMASAVARAARAGVPVVTIAGNRLSRESLPEVIRDWVNISDARTESWGIVPAMIPETIVAAAVDPDLDNAHFYGERVDVWAPIRSAYMSPSSVDDPDSALVLGSLGGTSAAAPFVTGVVAAMQALNENLNPATESLTAAQRSGIVSEIRALLTASENSFSNAELLALGYSDQPEERRRLIDPLAAVRAAAAPVLPELAGYDASLNFSEALVSDDTAAEATLLEVNVPATGTLVDIPAAGSATATTEDQDWYRFTVPDLGSASPLQVNLELVYPLDWGRVGLSGEGIVVQSRSSSGESALDTYAMVGEPGQVFTFRVAAAPGEDNVYRITAQLPEVALPGVEIVEPITTVPVCADQDITLLATARYALFPSFVVPSEAIEWFEGTASLGQGSEITASFPVGEHTITARAYGADEAEATLTFAATDCTGDAPEVSIISPTPPVANVIYDGYDDELELWYVDIAVEGTGTDTEDGTLPGSSLIWRTDRTDIQDEDLGTGDSATIRLYSDDCFGVTHTIRLEAADSDGNPASPDTFQVFIYTVC